MAGIVNSHNIMLKGNNSFPGVITDDTLTGNGTSASPLGVISAGSATYDSDGNVIVNTYLSSIPADYVSSINNVTPTILSGSISNHELTLSGNVPTAQYYVDSNMSGSGTLTKPWGLNDTISLSNSIYGNTAQYSYSGTRYVQDNGISANYTPTGIHYNGSDISADITNSKVEYDTTVAGSLTGTAIYKSNQITANNYRSNGLSSYFKIDLAPTQYNGNILSFSAKNSTATAAYDNYGEYASMKLTTTGGTYNGSYRADGAYFTGPSTGYSASKGMNSVSGVPIPSAATAHVDIQTDRGYIKLSNEGNHGVQISDYNVMSWLGYDQSRWVQLNPFALYFWDLGRKTGEPVAWISDRNMGFSMGTSAVNFSFEDLMKLKTIINAN